MNSKDGKIVKEADEGRGIWGFHFSKVAFDVPANDFASWASVSRRGRRLPPVLRYDLPTCKLAEKPACEVMKTESKNKRFEAILAKFAGKIENLVQLTGLPK